jgi:hypothetical protein
MGHPRRSLFGRTMRRALDASINSRYIKVAGVAKIGEIQKTTQTIARFINAQGKNLNLFFCIAGTLTAHGEGALRCSTCLHLSVTETRRCAAAFSTNLSALTELLLENISLSER